MSKQSETGAFFGYGTARIKSPRFYNRSLRFPRRADDNFFEPVEGVAQRMRDRLLYLLAAMLLIGCAAPRPPLVVTDPDPSVKIPAIQKAVREHDMSVLPQLIKDLENDDPAVRFYANYGLEVLTGQRLGFRYYDDDNQRAAAIARWKQWLDEYIANQNKAKGPQAVVQATSAPS